MTKQPYALAITYWLENLDSEVGYTDKEVARELRCLHEVNVELLEALEYAIGQVPDLATVPGIASVIAKAKGDAK